MKPVHTVQLVTPNAPKQVVWNKNGIEHGWESTHMQNINKQIFHNKQPRGWMLLTRQKTIVAYLFIPIENVVIPASRFSSCSLAGWPTLAQFYCRHCCEHYSWKPTRKVETVSPTCLMHPRSQTDRSHHKCSHSLSYVWRTRRHTHKNIMASSSRERLQFLNYNIQE